jgi:hypothetical protein
MVPYITIPDKSEKDRHVDKDRDRENKIKWNWLQHRF